MAGVAGLGIVDGKAFLEIEILSPGNHGGSIMFTARHGRRRFAQTREGSGDTSDTYEPRQ